MIKIVTKIYLLLNNYKIEVIIESSDQLSQIILTTIIRSFYLIAKYWSLNNFFTEYLVIIKC